MKLVDERKGCLDKPFSNYFGNLEKSKRQGELTLPRDFGASGRFGTYIVFLEKVVRENGKIKRRFVHQSP